MSDEAIIIGEGWLSDHFFTTDAKSQSFQARALARRKEWDEQDAEGTPSTRARFTAMRAQLETRLAALVPGDEDLAIRDEIYGPLRTVLGFTGGGYHLDQNGPLLRVTQPGLVDGSPFVIIEASPVDTLEDLLARDSDTLLVPFEIDDNDKHAISSVARLLSTIFVEDDGPIFALVLAGKWLLVAERERWAEGRYLAVDLQLAVARNDAKKGGEIDRALTCVSAESLAPNAEGDIWWSQVLEESIKHTVGVSQDLREGVRLSIEIIANDVVARRRRKGLEPLPGSEAQTLAKQSLRFLYRILFLLYAEASPELNVLPVGASEYEEGYSLDRLRELTLVKLATEQGENGTHLYESLAVLFRLVDRGHGVADPSPAPVVEPVETPSEASDLRDGLVFNSLRADLFLPKATAHIDEVQLSDTKLQEVLAHLLLSKEQKGRDRGFISYADLGINQLGAVYEGLMSYTGFFAETELYEVAKDGNADKGSWVVPVERSQSIEPNDFVQETHPITGETRARIHAEGSFVFRLAGRERQQSASYYTPEVLTRFTVSQALEELLDQDGTTTTAAEVLRLTVCEPALGSGAFALEAVRQLADQYLRRRQNELGERIDPDAYPRELQKAKASIALHQVYGVDLNSTAVELAEISLWLDTMSEELQAPWFGLHLRRGNSLIGARRAVYSRDQVNSRTWLTSVPRDVPVVDLFEDLRNNRLASGLSGSIHHFLLPAEGWGSATEAKEAKELAPVALADLRAWRRQFSSKPTKKQLDQLVNLSYRVETLWQFALRRLEIAEREVRRQIPLWGSPPAQPVETTPLVSREDIEAKLGDSDGAYQRLRRVMDAWNALWFWPLTDTLTEGVQPPSLDEWIAGLTALLGTHFEVKAKLAAQGQNTLQISSQWTALGTAEDTELAFAMVSPVDEALRTYPWLAVAESVAAEQGFFHWELDFATVFARGGFDLQVGNPPWVRPRSDIDSLLAEGDPWWQLAVNPTQAQLAEKKTATLSLTGIRGLVADGVSEVVAIAHFVGSPVNYPLLAGLQPDLYRCFMELAWRNASRQGVTALIHLETHFTDENGGRLRAATYKRLRRHWEFINELRLFEIQHQKHFGVNVYGAERDEPAFLSAVSLYHPDTVLRSLTHDGSGVEPGLKDPSGGWDLRPHQRRIINVDWSELRSWHDSLELSEVPVIQTRMVSAVNSTASRVMQQVSKARRLGELPFEVATGWPERKAVELGLIQVGWGEPDSWTDLVLQGTHIYVGNPLFRAPNPTMLHQTDWSFVDLESIGATNVPVAAYRPVRGIAGERGVAARWGDDRAPSSSYFRVAWRKMAANTGRRTLVSAIVPPGPDHVDSISVLGGPGLNASDLALVASVMSSLLADFLIRVSLKSNIVPSTVNRIPGVFGFALEPELVHRTLRLNCLVDAYAPLWRDSYQEAFSRDRWSEDSGAMKEYPLASSNGTWTQGVPLRRAILRRQAELEIDSLVALALGVSIDELCTIYRTQFPVLFGYDQGSYFYDANGRLVPNSVLTIWRSRGGRITHDERTEENSSGIRYTYELPFVTLNREADMRQAYAHFEKILEERS
ncbi:MULTISPECIES: DNA methyltransferase [unclassified Cryobacterium]|uniref:DNA methyltransferase n=1 Tax=unclassified Cryobacterium TaxID=2649013 RepID=UPI00106B8CAA|nr:MULTISPECIES: DNA methyltransferase [unclassified Cryobacterium]TFC50333.1 class I SAM-dependent DNA methyltransferase [Cryobacterium sp. TMB3-1-2]TFC71933.1 class I SAM-dependent DNA methyltransferase [Cryobacterium sp. TMB3-15]TFC78526.1 class I SAM-dependent DNA methyltransferase [Cryobacterium sp. TMB3-10]TFD44583.1 class I SAM-dependent DNA methyltransferase [Cryobacterium sp. TMB3-12]